MSLTTGIAIYFIVWWVVLFAVLPWGVTSQGQGDDIVPGTDPGAPVLHRMWLKLVVTTLVSGGVFGAMYAIYVYRLITLDQLARLLGMPN